MAETEEIQNQLKELQRALAHLQVQQHAGGAEPQVSAVSVKLSTFWPNKPAIWFAQAEAQFEIAGITKDATKYGHILSKLEPGIADEVEDVIANPPPENKYENLKSELIKRFSISREQRIRQLLGEEQMGDRKPSSFLRHLQSLAGKGDDSIVRELWMRRLPHEVQRILMAQLDLPLDKVADLADAIVETSPGVTSLRDVKLLVEPTYIIRGGTAALICSRDMQDSPLYSVKWYRGNHEFYRYTPLEDTPTRKFPIPGINVDLVRSNGSQVLLRKLDLNMAGTYSCEVTADSPSFATQIATKYVDVIALPSQDPVLKADKDRYEPGEVLRANCTTSPSKPAANLTIYINEEPLRSSETSLHPSDSPPNLQWTSVSAELKVTPELFPSGRLRVACVASIYEVYRRSAKLDFFTPETDPRPERITLNNGSTRRFQSWLLLFLLLLLPMVAMGQDYGLFNEESLDEFAFSEYYDEHQEHSIRSLVGG